MGTIEVLVAEGIVRAGPNLEIGNTKSKSISLPIGARDSSRME